MLTNSTLRSISSDAGFPRVCEATNLCYWQQIANKFNIPTIPEKNIPQQ